MLSYMLPMEEKPPLVPNKEHLQLNLEIESSSAGSPELLTNGNSRRSVESDSSNTVIASAVTHTVLKKTFNNAMGGVAKCSGPRHHIVQGNISKESSVSSFLSDATTASSMTPTSTISDKPKTKILANGTKHTTLKRVSFGSSKGSMVETLIYESPLQEEPENSPIVERPCPAFPTDCTDDVPDAAMLRLEGSKVRVSFFQQSTPQQILSSPLASVDDLLLLDSVMTATLPPSGALSATATITDINGHLQYNRQESIDSGWDNPFRPGGELSREAEEIVELIKGGKPITPTPGSVAPGLPSVEETDALRSVESSPIATPASTVDAASPLTQSPKQTSLAASPKAAQGLNGNAPVKSKQPGSVDVKRDTINSPGEAEHVVLKKKPKCKCCVIQ